MMKYSLIALFFIMGFTAQAQTKDSLFASRRGANWGIKYFIKPGETMRMLAFRFYITEDQLAVANDFDDIKKLMPYSLVNIPVNRENYFTVKPPLDIQNIRELYYKVGQRDDIGVISTYAGITKGTLRQWNNLHGNTLNEGEVLFIGWLKMFAFDTSNPENEKAYFIPRKKVTTDSVKVKVLGGLDTVFNRQTANGVNVLTEKGTAVFFDKPGKNNVYYAFHNTTPPGGVIKVYNPGTGKTIYVKVLAKIPNTKLYANSIIGISNTAKEALGVTDTKAWCELTYAIN